MNFYTLVQTNSKTPKDPFFKGSPFFKPTLCLFLIYYFARGNATKTEITFFHTLFHEPLVMFHDKKKWPKVEDKDWEMGSQHKARAMPRTLIPKTVPSKVRVYGKDLVEF
jgi:hypothetical protein